MSRNAMKRGMAIMLAGLIALPSAGAAFASPAPPGAGAAAATQLQGGSLTQARWDRHGRRHWRHHRHWRGHWRHGRHWHHDHFNPGAALAIGLIGSLVASGLSEGSARSAIDRCEANYRSFEPSTGLYTTYGGEKRLCPYLR